jgi:hypothetical protein
MEISQQNPCIAIIYRLKLFWKEKGREGGKEEGENKTDFLLLPASFRRAASGIDFITALLSFHPPSTLSHRY